MGNSNRMADIYLRFLHLAESINRLPSLPALDPLEERILGLVARAARLNDRLCVRDIMAKEEFGSPATIHSRLKSMRGKGWIILQDTEDARRKQIGLTDEAVKHFERLSDCMLEAARVAR